MSLTENEVKTIIEQGLTVKEKIAGLKILSFLKKQITKKEKLIGKIQWMTGSNGERSLPFLKHTHYTLLPTGALLDQGIAPCAGELMQGVRPDGVNQNCLSGVLPNNFDIAWGYANLHKSFNLESAESRCFHSLNCNIDSLINNFLKKPNSLYMLTESCALYILQARQFNEKRYQEEFIKSGKIEKVLKIISDDENFSIFHEKKRVEEAFALQLPNDVLKENDKTGVKILDFISSKGVKCDVYVEDFEINSYDMMIISRKHLDRASDVYLNFFEGSLPGRILFLKASNLDYVMENKDFINEFIQKRILMLKRSQTRLISAIKKGPSYHYSENEKKEMQELTALPVVFSSTKGFCKSEGGMNGEILHKGNMKIGQDIDLIVTNIENQDRLKQYLAKKGLTAPNTQVCTDVQVKRVFKK